MLLHLLWLAGSIAAGAFGLSMFAAGAMSLDDNSPLFRIGGLAFVAGAVSLICCIANWLL